MKNEGIKIAINESVNKVFDDLPDCIDINTIKLTANVEEYERKEHSHSSSDRAVVIRGTRVNATAKATVVTSSTVEALYCDEVA